MTAHHVAPPTAAAVSELSDDELLVLESTLRVQLEVARHVRIAQVTGTIGVAMLAGGLAAIRSGISIVTSQVQRTKCKRRHREVSREVLQRGLSRLVQNEKPLGKRAFAISVSTGCVCCILSFAADLLIDRAVIQVVSEVVMNFVNDYMVGTLGAQVAAGLAGTVFAASQPKKLKSVKSWAAFSWKEKKNKSEMQERHVLKTESMPDLFGERELLDVETSGSGAAWNEELPQEVKIRRSTDFKPYGEFLELRFAPIHPGFTDHDANADVPVDSVVPSHRSGRTMIVHEVNALSESHWLSLRTLEDGPIDVVEVDAPYDRFDIALVEEGEPEYSDDEVVQDDCAAWNLFGSACERKEASDGDGDACSLRARGHRL